MPIVYLSSYWWRTLHPQPAIGPLAEQQPAAEIGWLLAFGVVAFIVLFAFLVSVRVAIDAAEARRTARMELSSASA